MSVRAHGQVRRAQVITTYGPGALIDLPRHSGIVGGLDTWPTPGNLQQLAEPRLTQKLEALTGVKNPRLYEPPPDVDTPGGAPRGIGVWRFPEWFVVQESVDTQDRRQSRRLVHRRALDNRSRFDGRPVVATRFVRACPRGHVDDLDWRGYVHGTGDNCRRQLWLDERGTSGDLADLFVRCECGKQRPLYQAAERDLDPLGFCRGTRPWLGNVPQEECNQPARLLIRTASNAYFPQVMSVLSLPNRGSAVGAAVKELWSILQAVDDAVSLSVMKKLPHISERLESFADDEVLAAIKDAKGGTVEDKPVKLVELEAILAAPVGFGDDLPIDPDFHARRLPDSIWRRSTLTDGVQAVTQLHRLREVLALAGFTRFEAQVPDINGEYDTDVERAEIAIDPSWFPAVENHGEGLFLQLKPDALAAWLARPAVKERLDALHLGHESWKAARSSRRDFPGGPYILLHTLAHLLMQSLAMRCGYPSSSIRERIYADYPAQRFGLLLYTASPDAEGTLGGLVQQARHLEDHLAQALRMAELCSNDPICAQHAPGESPDTRYLHGAACHGCTLVAETACEMSNEYLDRALVVPVLGTLGTAFFPHLP